jgi:hypothetical protein
MAGRRRDAAVSFYQEFGQFGTRGNRDGKVSVTGVRRWMEDGFLKTRG